MRELEECCEVAQISETFGISVSSPVDLQLEILESLLHFIPVEQFCFFAFVFYINWSRQGWETTQDKTPCEVSTAFQTMELLPGSQAKVLCIHCMHRVMLCGVHVPGLSMTRDWDPGQHKMLELTGLAAGARHGL